MSIQKAVASAFAITQETSISLASLNFDFSLVRVDAPPSFKGLGNELTSSRKKAAEEGTPHITARKLGALFLDLLPSTPALIQAYGDRVTQIASRRDVNPKSAKIHGLFADHVGIDGTSIWAAATSGPEAIAVHLLTCLLARIWTAPEAISIWVELVAQRKRDLVAVEETETTHLRSMEASRISISREQLAEWDASARAWLRAADDAMGTKQKQLMLILNNVDLPVNKKPSVYSSVMDAWKSSLVVVDKLVQGIPQSVKDGSVGLGLASWHIYPDMLVLGDSQKEILQKDDVVAPGALLTIGLHLKGQEQTGVHWSLPLSHLRYYGRPVVAKRSLEDQANRLTLDQLILVAVASITKNWKLSHEEIARGFRGLWDYVADEAPSYCALGTTHWLGTFAKATDLLLESDKLTMKSALQLMRFAERRASHFAIPLSSHHLVPSMFGLLEYKTYFDALTLQGKVESLRQRAQMLSSKDGERYIIRFFAEDSSAWGYTTALPIHRLSTKRKVGGSSQNAYGHIRWVGKMDQAHVSAFEELGEEVVSIESAHVSIQEESDEDMPRVINWTESTEHLRLFSSISHDRVVFSAFTVGEVGHVPIERKFSFLFGDLSAAIFFSEQSQDSTVDFSSFKDAAFTLPGTSVPSPSAETAQNPPASSDAYEDFVREDSDSNLGRLTRQLDPNDLTAAFGNKWFDKQALLRYLHDFLSDPIRPVVRTSFRALATVSNIYKLLPDATIALRVISTPLQKMPWIPSLNPSGGYGAFSAFPADWATTFSCIVQFESGSLDVSPDACTKVMALSVGDSLYVAVPLLCDPIEEPSPYEVRRIRGNVGTPGIAMLIPPAQLESPEYDTNKWNLINHEPYDGRLEDSFQATSLHMSFTGFTLPVDLQSRGLRDTELYYMETRVTVHDHGAEVADLDILGSLQNKTVRRIPSCQHDTSFNSGPNKAIAHNSMLTMVDNWFELLDDPERAAVARSSGNWLGRLSLAIVSLQLGYHVIILPQCFCWPCIHDSWKYIRSRANISDPANDVPTTRWAAFNCVDPLTVSEKDASEESNGDKNASVDAIDSVIRDLYAPIEIPVKEFQPIDETFGIMPDLVESAEEQARKLSVILDDIQKVLKEMGESRVILIC